MARGPSPGQKCFSYVGIRHQHLRLRPALLTRHRQRAASAWDTSAAAASRGIAASSQTSSPAEVLLHGAARTR